ncbi:hypothetical protein Slin15195_G007780 [Septoria linicola]|uniref:Uncharacterized protein n=1 Tax=Septoria linicola TaxID=215465 RepID=A0A9Q9EF01_9PEZI|nr:hypothetical protein Slin14017_G007790 [Septoria linicola]USW47459.1 hypothetical protein Slin15195_G007780 [Septoria linicola]
MSSDRQEETRVKAEVDSALALVLTPNIKPSTRDFLQIFYQKMASVNQVHPLFAWSSWIGVTKKEYLSLLPALALASRMLTWPATTNFISSLIYCPTTIRMDSKGKPRRQVRLLCSDPERPLDDEAQKRFDEALLRLVPYVRLTSSSLSANKYAEAVAEDPIEGWSPGVHSRIELNQKHINETIPADNTIHKLLLCYRELAQTLVHELMHVIGYAMSGPKDGERFLVGQKFAENGFAWEVVAMGGIVELKDRHENFDMKLQLKEINVAELVKAYKDISFPISSPGGPRGMFIRDISGLEVMAEFNELYTAL